MTAYSKKYVLDSLFKGIRNLWHKQPDLSLGFTEETLEHEPNLSFHIVNEIWPFFRDLDCDFDVTKKNFGKKRPDIIFHKRGVHERNLMVIEVKRASNSDVSNGICEDDEVKICTEWFDSPLSYTYGVSLVMDERIKTFSLAFFVNSKDRNMSPTCDRYFGICDTRTSQLEIHPTY